METRAPPGDHVAAAGARVDVELSQVYNVMAVSTAAARKAADIHPKLLDAFGSEAGLSVLDVCRVATERAIAAGPNDDGSPYVLEDAGLVHTGLWCAITEDAIRVVLDAAEMGPLYSTCGRRHRHRTKTATHVNQHTRTTPPGCPRASVSYTEII